MSKQKQLHVAMLIGALTRGGSERVMVNLSNDFLEKGWKVTLVTQYKKKGEYTLNPGVKRIISDITEAESGRSRVLNFKKRFQKLRGIWKQERPDVILSFIGKNNMMAILTACGLDIPVAVSVRGEPTMEYYNGWMRFMARHLFARADGVILQTSRCFDFFPEKVKKKAVLLRNPVSDDFFRPRYEGQRDKELVTVGRLDDNKNQEMLIRAFAQIKDQYPEYKLTVIGDGECRKKLENLVKELGMEEKVRFTGSISNVADAIYKTRVFILPSDTEGVPNTLIEAMLMGLTVIATDCPCGGPADLIEDGKNGLLTPVGDVNKMKENLQKVLNDLQKADSMGTEASKTGDIFKPEIVYGEWEKYLYLLTSRRKR